ncbi:unnamed protein product [Meloidogyne enterolobii]|uniref:Uncharacterized protein n=1 Tax=Meloidogyne enterolobii TaxID=390850 RepID=A0ACB1ACA7_MELEN
MRPWFIFFKGSFLIAFNTNGPLFEHLRYVNTENVEPSLAMAGQNKFTKFSFAYINFRTHINSWAVEAFIGRIYYFWDAYTFMGRIYYFWDAYTFMGRIYYFWDA